jgi:hypothetical protein
MSGICKKQGRDGERPQPGPGNGVKKDSIGSNLGVENDLQQSVSFLALFRFDAWVDFSNPKEPWRGSGTIEASNCTTPLW